MRETVEVGAVLLGSILRDLLFLAVGAVVLLALLCCAAELAVAAAGAGGVTYPLPDVAGPVGQFLGGLDAGSDCGGDGND